MSDSLPTRKIAGYGWKPDLPDVRDLLYAAPPVTLPKSIDLRPGCPPVFDQGQLGSCTANAINAAVEYGRSKQKLPDMRLSRLFTYYGEREIEGSIDQDAGAMIRDGMKVVAKLGVPAETDWPYEIGQFAQKPPQKAYADALSDQVLRYLRVSRTLPQMRACLASGYPFVFGFTVYASFESAEVAKSGIVPMPAAHEEVLGGHAVLAVGYDDDRQQFIVRNSWGSGWGLQGYFWMPYAYLTTRGLASDYWTVRTVEG
jgi:C1A family cysteine protease